MIGRIIKIARSIVQGILNTAKAQINIIQMLVTAPLRMIVNQVTGGAWKGDGANRFVNEMSSEVIPQLVNIMNINTNFFNAIKKAVDRMDQAEKSAKSLVQPLFDVFSKIY